MIPAKSPPQKYAVHTIETIARSVPGASYFQTRYAAMDVKARPIAYAGRTAIYSPADASRIVARIGELLARRGVRHGQ